MAVKLHEIPWKCIHMKAMRWEMWWCGLIIIVSFTGKVLFMKLEIINSPHQDRFLELFMGFLGGSFIFPYYLLSIYMHTFFHPHFYVSKHSCNQKNRQQKERTWRDSVTYISPNPACLWIICLSCIYEHINYSNRH